MVASFRLGFQSVKHAGAKRGQYREFLGLLIVPIFPEEIKIRRRNAELFGNLRSALFQGFQGCIANARCGFVRCHYANARAS